MPEINSSARKGPPMIWATDALRTGPPRVGKIAGKVSLPRTVALTTLLAAGLGAVAGFMFTAAVVRGDISTIVMGVILGGAVGWFVTTVSPMPGENLATWFILTLNAYRTRKFLDGKPVRMAVGPSYSSRVPLKRVLIEPSAVRVAPGTVDDRGVLRTESNKNVSGAYVRKRSANTVPSLEQSRKEQKQSKRSKPKGSKSKGKLSLKNSKK